MKHVLANALGYQAVWFVAVLSAAAGLAWPGVVAGVVFFALQRTGPRGRRADLALAGAAILAGALLDGGLAAAGWLRYSATTAWSPAPLWILGIWIGFAATLERSLRFLQRRPVLTVLLAGIGGPLAYLAAARLEAVVVVVPVAATVSLAIGWAVILPALVWLSTPRPAPLAAVGEPP